MGRKVPPLLGEGSCPSITEIETTLRQRTKKQFERIKTAIRNETPSVQNILEVVLDCTAGTEGILANQDISECRIRLIDYTGHRLVPGAIRGKLMCYDPKFAIRERDECIVGLAISNPNGYCLENNVQANKQFQAYRKSVLKRAKSEPGWGKYHDECLASLGSELAVAIIASQDLLGVLNIHSPERDAFTREDAENLSFFATHAVGAAILQKQNEVLKELHAIEDEMTSSFNLEEVACKITEGLSKLFPNSIPNLFRYDEVSKAWFELAEGVRVRLSLDGFKPRADGIGAEMISAVQSGLLEKERWFKVVEDVDDEVSQGNPSPVARANGIKTTVCLPLVFRDEAVGALYLHYKERRYFTGYEKLTLQMFADQAAIAIINAKQGKTFRDLYGALLSVQIRELSR